MPSPTQKKRQKKDKKKRQKKRDKKKEDKKQRKTRERFYTQARWSPSSVWHIFERAMEKKTVTTKKMIFEFQHSQMNSRGKY